MSPLTIFLAKLLGLFTLVFAAALFLRGQDIVAAMLDLTHDRADLVLFGMLALASGLAIVLAHNRWSGAVLTIIVTVVGWVLVLRGTLILFLPSSLLDSFIAALEFERWIYLYAALPFLLGAYLTYAGFTAEKS
jgi:hypothetical protein